MCGVCGIVSLGEPIHGDRTRESVDAMVRALAHRGPDDSGVASNSGGILGATRLAIRGLHSGRQPIVDEATGLIVVCNGEIDNHRDLRRWLETRGRPVKLETDIAVISGLYLELGEEFVERLVGVFAIAIWDTQKQRLLLARDRAGERPLFFTTADGVIHFATEMAALATDVTSNRTLAQSAVAEYLQYGSVVAPRTLFAEIEKVAPGEMVVIDSAGTRRRRYWRWGIGRVPKTAPSVEAFDQVFRRAVARQSDIDVPYGVFLSGGIDSSLVAAVARSVRPGSPLTAYSLRFGEESYDEGEFAGQVAKQLGLSPVSVWVKPEVLPEMVAELIDSVGEPLADPAWIPTALLARRAAQDVKLALVGEGADELFGGYPTYLGARVGEHYARLPGPVRALLRRAIEAWPVTDKKVTISALLKRFVQGPADDGVARHLTWTSNISPALLKRLGLEPIRSRVPGALPGDLLDAVQQID
ncbi:MAG TPA: asparagine synthase (glutamine-hydrolyzing), partial [Verrucomicrobiae bacterium]|nr:asparagine synthase (glutamine-hydrolyzing) [Verrucomicrobiae bacterium]